MDAIDQLPSYNSHTCLRAVPATCALVLPLGILGLLTLMGLALGGQTGHVQHFFSSLSKEQVAIIVPSAVVGTTLLTAAVFKAAVEGKLSGDKHWKEVHYTMKGQKYEGWLDTSTLDKKGEGNALIYAKKSANEHYTISSLVVMATPIYIVVSVAWNALRSVGMFFYCAVQWMRGKEGYNWYSSFVEFGRSIFRMVRAPFYGIAFMIAALWSFYSPLNGRKAASYIEWHWNDGIPRHKSIWVYIPENHYNTSCDRTYEEAGGNGYYLPGCWQPMGEVIIEDGKVKEAYTPSGENTIELDLPGSRASAASSS